jgi:type VI protein secretion system component VasA
VLNENHFASMSDSYLFSRILHLFLMSFVEINVYMESRVSFLVSDEQWRWEGMG